MNCDICQNNENIELHHIMPDNHITKHKPVTIPLCKECHIKVHCFYRNSDFSNISNDEYLQCFREYEKHRDKYFLQSSLFEYYNMLYKHFKRRELYEFCTKQE